MSINYTADGLVVNIQLLGLFPDSQVLLTSDNLLALMNFQMSAELVPIIDSAAEEFFVHYEDIAYDPAIRSYGIPTRAVGSKLRDLVFVDSNNNEIQIPRLRPEDIKVGFQYGIGYNMGLYGFYLKDQTIQLFLGNPQAVVSYPFLRMKFFRRPSQLIPTNQAGLIAAINFGTNEVTVTTIPTDWVNTNTFDFVQGIPHFTSKGDDRTVATIAGNTLTFSSSLPTDLAVGDWVALAGESPIPQVPYDAFSLLSQLTIIKGLEANRDTEGMKNAMASLPQIKQNFLQIITPRVDGSVVKVTGRGNISNWI